MEDPFDPGYVPYQKKRHASFGSVSINSGFVQILQASQKRVAIVFSPHGGTELQYAPDSARVGHNTINLPSSSSPLILDEVVVGDIVKRAWFVQPTTVGQTAVGFIEVMTD
jgi:hypothetical protein